MFSLTIATDNAAFADDPAGEVARILEDVSRRLLDHDVTTGACRDSNGNTVGTFLLDVAQKGAIRPSGR